MKSLNSNITISSSSSPCKLFIESKKLSISQFFTKQNLFTLALPFPTVKGATKTIMTHRSISRQPGQTQNGCGFGDMWMNCALWSRTRSDPSRTVPTPQVTHKGLAPRRKWQYMQWLKILVRLFLKQHIFNCSDLDSAFPAVNAAQIKLSFYPWHRVSWSAATHAMPRQTIF